MRTGHRDSKTRTVEAGNLAAWMEDTGEFWLLHGTAVVSHGANTFLPLERFVAEWREGLARAMHMLDQYGANTVRRVEAGVHGVKDVRYVGHGQIEPVKARRNQAAYSQTLALWDEQAQSNFLMEATNKIHNLFAQPHISSDEWPAFLSQCRK